MVFPGHRNYAIKSNWGSKPKFSDYLCGVLPLPFYQVLPTTNFYSIYNRHKNIFPFTKN
jgi:hypothetical protein